MTYGLAVLIAVLTALAAAGATGVMVRVLARRRILDHPNERSSHVRATPRGAGLAVVPALLVAWAIVAALAPDARVPIAWVLAGALLLAAVSWRDDLKSLPALPRLAAQAVAVLAGLMTFGGDVLVFQGLLPFWADRLVAALAWLWFVNLFNFMDGIDGLAGTETAAIGLGLALLVAVRRRRRRALRARPGAGRRGLRLPAVELASGAHLLGRCRQRAARLSARLAAALGRRRRLLGRRAHPAALLSGRCHPDLAAPPPARRAGLAGPSRALLSARDPGRPRPWRGRGAGRGRRRRA